jgi:nanoRNase/pAp phosphatase (c-di-AMP/oligoRNAs hydrolase)
MAKTKAQIVVYVNLSNGTAHLRSAKGVDCSKLAEHFRGGGHPQAAGFQPPSGKFMNFNTEGRRRFMDCMTKRVQEVYP